MPNGAAATDTETILHLLGHRGVESLSTPKLGTKTDTTSAAARLEAYDRRHGLAKPDPSTSSPVARKIEWLYDVALGINPQEVLRISQEMTGQPGLAPKVVGGIEQIVGSVPLVGLPTVRAMAASGRKEYGQAAIESGIAIISGLMAPKIAGDVAERIATRGAARYLPESAHELQKAGLVKVLTSPDMQSQIIGRYVHARGLQVQRFLTEAVGTMRSQIGQLAQHVSDTVDSKFPTGAINATKVMEETQAAWKQIFAIAQKYPREIEALLEEEPVAANTQEAARREILKGASVFRGARGPTVDVKDLLRYASPQTRERVLRSITEAEGETPPGAIGVGRWSFEQAKQLRSQVGRAIGRIGDLSDPRAQRSVRAALSAAYASLSGPLKEAAEQAGVGGQYQLYNQLEKHLDQVLLKGPLREILRARSGQAVAQALLRDRAVTRELVSALERRGVGGAGALDQFVKEFATTRALTLSKQTMGPFFRRNWPLFILGYVASRHLGIPFPYLGGIALGMGGPVVQRARLAARLREIPPELMKILEERAGPVIGQALESIR